MDISDKENLLAFPARAWNAYAGWGMRFSDAPSLILVVAVPTLICTAIAMATPWVLLRVF